MDRVVAEQHLDWIRAEAAATKVSVRLARPQPCDDLTRRWQTSVTIAPLCGDAPQPVYGADMAQTLSIAIGLAVRRLDRFVSEGGTLRHEDGSPFRSERLIAALVEQAWLRVTETTPH